MPALQVPAVHLQVVGLRSSEHGVRAGSEPGFTASTTPAAISSWMAKTSIASRSNRSDQGWYPLATSLSCAVTRSRVPDVRTLPSSTRLAEPVDQLLDEVRQIPRLELIARDPPEIGLRASRSRRALAAASCSPSCP